MRQLISNDQKTSLDIQRCQYSSFKSVVYPVIRKYCKNVFDIEDIIHEVYIKSEKYFHTYHEDNLNSWLKTIAKNETLHYLKKYQANKEVFSDGNTLDYYSTKSQNTFHDKHLTDSIETLETIKIIEQLQSKNLSEVLRLRLIDDLSYKQIAKKLNISETAVRQRFHRSINYIRKKM